MVGCAIKIGTHKTLTYFEFFLNGESLGRAPVDGPPTEESFGGYYPAMSVSMHSKNTVFKYKLDSLKFALFSPSICFLLTNLFD